MTGAAAGEPGPSLEPRGLRYVLVEASRVPADDDWLTDDEIGTLRGLHVPRRRAEWRLGRWAAKRAVAAALGDLPPEEVRILARRDGAPEAWIGGRSAPVAVSISHRAERALGAAAGGDVALGCDLELVEPRSETFARGVLTEAERATIELLPGPRRNERITLLWSAKESALKALGVSVATEPASFVVEPDGSGAGWSPLVITKRGRRFRGWWRRLGPLVATVVADPAPDRPIEVAS